METITNLWTLVFTVISIIVLLILIKKLQFKGEKTPSLYETLRQAGIFPTIRKLINQKKLKGDKDKDQNNNQKP